MATSAAAAHFDRVANNSMWQRIQNWFHKTTRRPLSDEEFQQKRRELLTDVPIPVFWLFGKTGSGKTSIVRFLTNAERATIGNGFRPETKQSQRYDFPSAEQPLIQFLDTRGLGEVGYDPQEDIAAFADTAQLMLVTIRVGDRASGTIVEPLRQIRKANPDRPVVLAITCLHEMLGKDDLPDPDPFSGSAEGSSEEAREVGTRQSWDDEHIPPLLRQTLDSTIKDFEGLFDAVVPIDFTLPEDGYRDPNYGGERLTQTLVQQLPAAYRQSFLTMTDVLSSLEELHEEQAGPYILAAATMAATAAAVPVPWVDIPVVAGIQSDLVRRLSGLYEQSLDWQQFLQMAGAVGGRLLLRQAVRAPLKLVPVLGQAANSALAFASTYGLGEACCWYYGKRLSGHAPTKAELKEVMQDRMSKAESLWKRHHDKK